MRVRKSGQLWRTSGGRGDERNEGVSVLANHTSPSHEDEHDFAEYQKNKTAATHGCTVGT
eukprot:6482130-Prymnesium_polylepis.1